MFKLAYPSVQFSRVVGQPVVLVLVQLQREGGQPAGNGGAVEVEQPVPVSLSNLSRSHSPPSVWGVGSCWHHPHTLTTLTIAGGEGKILVERLPACRTHGVLLQPREKTASAHSKRSTAHITSSIHVHVQKCHLHVYGRMYIGVHVCALYVRQKHSARVQECMATNITTMCGMRDRYIELLHMYIRHDVVLRVEYVATGQSGGGGDELLPADGTRLIQQDQLLSQDQCEPIYTAQTEHTIKTHSTAAIELAPYRQASEYVNGWLQGLLQPVPTFPLPCVELACALLDNSQ